MFGTMNNLHFRIKPTFYKLSTFFKKERAGIFSNICYFLVKVWFERHL